MRRFEGPAKVPHEGTPPLLAPVISASTSVYRQVFQPEFRVHLHKESLLRIGFEPIAATLEEE